MPGFATKISFKMLCPQSCGSLDTFQFLTIKNASAGKACFIKTNRQPNSQQILSSLALMWRFTSKWERPWGLNSSLAWTFWVSWKNLDQIKPILRQRLSCQDEMGSLLFLWDSGLISSFCHSYFLSPLANPPGFTADVRSLLEIIVQAKRLVQLLTPSSG